MGLTGLNKLAWENYVRYQIYLYCSPPSETELISFLKAMIRANFAFLIDEFQANPTLEETLQMHIDDVETITLHDASFIIYIKGEEESIFRTHMELQLYKFEIFNKFYKEFHEFMTHEILYHQFRAETQEAVDNLQIVLNEYL